MTSVIDNTPAYVLYEAPEAFGWILKICQVCSIDWLLFNVYSGKYFMDIQDENKLSNNKSIMGLATG